MMKKKKKIFFSVQKYWLIPISWYFTLCLQVLQQEYYIYEEYAIFVVYSFAFGYVIAK